MMLLKFKGTVKVLKHKYLLYDIYHTFACDISCFLEPHKGNFVQKKSRYHLTDNHLHITQ